jgi:Trp operon repressor
MTKNKALVLKKIASIVAKLESEKDVENFLRAFMTPKECDTLCDRYLLIEMLMAGTPQRIISEKLGVSISQISRGSAELQFGVGREVFPKVFPQP